MFNFKNKIFVLTIFTVIIILCLLDILNFKFKKDNIFHNYLYINKVFIFSLLILSVGIIKNYTILKIISIVFLLKLLFFFRNNYKLDNKVNYKDIISPCSSLVKNINNNYITTYLSPLDRHFVIAPFDCTIIDIKNVLYKNDQERKVVTISDINNNMSQLHLIVKKPFTGPGILGSWMPKLFYKERIVIFNKKGDNIKQGERIGLIRFGSSMEFDFNNIYTLNLKNNEKISLGQVIGKW